jgi:glucan biosynthesis protein C
MEAKKPQRRYDLDWLRVLAFSGVFFYHCSRFFNTAGWHVKNAQTSSLVDIFTGIFDLFGMPMIFAISGASIFFALRPGGARRFLRERALRLLLPLGVGILVLAPPQVYLDRLTHGLFKGSFLEFLPYYFQPANFSWNGVHLWYLQYLFVFTLLLMPLFIWLRRPSGQRALRTLSRLSARTGAIFLWAVPLAMISIVADPFNLMKQGLSETLLRLIMFPLPLIYGYLIYADHAIQQAIIRQRRAFLFVSVGCSFVPPLVSTAINQWGWKIDLLSYSLLMALASLLIWCYLLAAFGYGMHYLTSPKRSLAYANEAVLPFYILHQPVILILGYFIIQLQVPIVVKYLIITPLALSITLVLYEYGIRRVNSIRRAFGLKPLKPDSTSVKVVTQWS